MSVTDIYFLGKYNKDVQEPDYINNAPNIKWRALGDNNRVAMFSVKYTDGTPCEILPDTFREITIFYGNAKNIYIVTFN